MTEVRVVRVNQGGWGTTALQLLFIALKLTHVINWSWWWVLSPLWITASLAALIIGAVILKQRFKDKTNFR